MTPIKQALNKCNELASNKADNANSLHCLRDMQELLQSLLPIEQQLISDTWDASDKRSRYLQRLHRGLVSVIGDDENFPDKQTYLTKVKEVNNG